LQFHVRLAEELLRFEIDPRVFVRTGESP